MRSSFRRTALRPAAENHIERASLERAEASSIRDAAPEFLKGLPRARPVFKGQVTDRRAGC
jgi:hypothetical protein